LFIELIGETVHMVMLNASHIGALLDLFRERLNAKRK